MISNYRCGIRGYPFSHPSGGCCSGIHIKQTPPGRIGPQYGIGGSLIGFRIRLQADLSVIHAGKCSWLIYNLLNRIGKPGRLHAVQNDGSYGHLTDIGLASGFAMNDLSQQMDILCLSTGRLGYLVDELGICLLLIASVMSQTQPRKQRKKQNEADRHNVFHIYPSSENIICRKKACIAGKF